MQGGKRFSEENRKKIKKTDLGSKLLRQGLLRCPCVLTRQPLVPGIFVSLGPNFLAGLSGAAPAVTPAQPSPGARLSGHKQTARSLRSCCRKQTDKFHSHDFTSLLKR